MTPAPTRSPRPGARRAVGAAVAAAARWPSCPHRPRLRSPARARAGSRHARCPRLHGPARPGSRFASAVAAGAGCCGAGRTVRPVRPDDGTVVVDGAGASARWAWWPGGTDRRPARRERRPPPPCPAPAAPHGGSPARAAGSTTAARWCSPTSTRDRPSSTSTWSARRGEVDEAALRGITVSGGTARVVRLIDVAPRSDEVTVHVTTTQGRVVAQVRDVVRVPSGVGSEWLPPPRRLPATDVRLLGLPSVADRRTLLVTNPSERQALVDRAGGHPGRGLRSYRCRRGLSRPRRRRGRRHHGRRRPGLRRTAAPLRRRGPRRPSAAGSPADIAYAGATDVATGFLAAPATGGATTLLLQGADAATGGTVQRVVDRGPEGRHPRVVGPAERPGHMDRSRGSAYVVLEPDAGRGEVHAAVVTTGTGVTGLPLVEVPTTQRRPVVVMRTE